MDRNDYIGIRKKLTLKKSEWRLVLYFGQDLILISAIYSLLKYLPESLLRFASVPLLTILFFRNFSQMHDAVHSASSRFKYANEITGILCGIICFLPFEAWKKVHLEHHLWSGNFEKDPVMGIVKAFPQMSSERKNFLNLFWNSWIPLLAALQYNVFWTQSTKKALSSKQSIKMHLSLGLPILIWASVIGLSSNFFFLEILMPAVILYFLASEIVNFPHHLELPHQTSERPIPVWLQYRSARSCIYPDWFSKYAVLNFNYHTEHHMFPDAPWYHLKQIHQILAPELAEKYNRDDSFSWILKNRSQNLNLVFGYETSEEQTEKTSSSAAA